MTAHAYYNSEQGPDWNVPLADRDDIADDLESGEIMSVGTLVDGPVVYCANIPNGWDEDGDVDNEEVRWFDTEAAAQAAVDSAVRPERGQRE